MRRGLAIVVSALFIAMICTDGAYSSGREGRGGEVYHGGGSSPVRYHGGGSAPAIYHGGGSSPVRYQGGGSTPARYQGAGSVPAGYRTGGETGGHRTGGAPVQGLRGVRTPQGSIAKVGGTRILTGNLGRAGQQIIRVNYEPRSGPHGKNLGRWYWGFYRGNWSRYWVFVDRTWWWYTEDRWVRVKEGPRVVYITESEAENFEPEDADCNLPICCVNGACKLMKGEADCSQAGGYIVDSCCDCQEAQCQLPICCVQGECKLAKDEPSCVQQGGSVINSCCDCRVKD